jgi:hypothetical protein
VAHDVISHHSCGPGSHSSAPPAPDAARSQRTECRWRHAGALPPRPSTARLAINQASQATPPRRRPKSGTVINAQPPNASHSALSPQACDTHPYAWDIGNVSSTGSMVGAPYRCLSSCGSSGTPSQPRQAFSFILQPHRRPRAKEKAARVAAVTDTHLPQAVLHVTVQDRLTGNPVRSATVVIAEFGAFLQGHVVNSGSTEQRSTKADSAGRVRCSVLASRRCAYSFVRPAGFVQIWMPPRVCELPWQALNDVSSILGKSRAHMSGESHIT